MGLGGCQLWPELHLNVQDTEWVVALLVLPCVAPALPRELQTLVFHIRILDG